MSIPRDIGCISKAGSPDPTTTTSTLTRFFADERVAAGIVDVRGI